MKQLLIIRGLPGSGKTTFAESIVHSEHIVCHDEFMQVGDRYVFTEAGLDRAKLLSFAKFLGLVGAGVERIAYTAVSPNLADAKRYAKVAENAGYMVVWLVVENRHGNKTVHNVPETTIEGMRQGFKIQL